jgi:cell division transport system ATP-binding protein
MILFQNVHKSYKKEVPVFKNLSIQIEQGEFVIITGAPGSGKTTFLKLILNEESPTEGDIFYEGIDLDKMSGDSLKKYRRDLGAIFQDFKLLPFKTAYENIAFALEVMGESDAEIKKDTEEVLEIIGLSHRQNHFPNELSGGEKQKVAIGRALIGRPKVILADEPTGSLDEETAKEILDVLRAINSLGTTIVMTTHNERLIQYAKGARRLHIKEHGVIHDEQNKIKHSDRIVSESTSEEILLNDRTSI